MNDNPLASPLAAARWLLSDTTGSLPAGVGASLLTRRVGRRMLLQAAGAGAGLLLAGQSMGGARSVVAARRPAPGARNATTGLPHSAGTAPVLGFAFCATNQEVTTFDAATLQPIETRPLGATVRWFGNEQHAWDGRHLWTYDYPGNMVDVLAVDPRSASVARRIPTGGRGPAFSVELTPDRAAAWIDIAGDDRLAIIDVARGEVIDQIGTGAFPWDLHFTPDGRFGFVPELNQNTVAKFDLATRTLVKRISFPDGSMPWMNRVSPDGRVVWLQTGGTHTNVVLDADTMEVLQETPVGQQPATNAFQPRGPYGIVTHLMDSFIVVLDKETGAEVTRIDVGGPQSVVSFVPDGSRAFVTVGGRNDVVAIDMHELAVAGRIATAERPWGIILLEQSLLAP